MPLEVALTGCGKRSPDREKQRRSFDNLQFSGNSGVPELLHVNLVRSLFNSLKTLRFGFVCAGQFILPLRLSAFGLADDERFQGVDVTGV